MLPWSAVADCIHHRCEPHAAFPYRSSAGGFSFFFQSWSGRGRKGLRTQPNGDRSSAGLFGVKRDGFFFLEFSIFLLGT